MPRNPLVFGLVFGTSIRVVSGVSTKSGFVTYTWCFDGGFTGVGNMFLGGNVSQRGLANFLLFFFLVEKDRQRELFKEPLV